MVRLTIGDDSRLTLKYFSADDCLPCKQYEPAILRVVEKYSGMMNYSKIDVRALPKVAKEHGVNGIPYVILEKERKELYSYAGNMGINELIKNIERFK